MLFIICTLLYNEKLCTFSVNNVSLSLIYYFSISSRVQRYNMIDYDVKTSSKRSEKIILKNDWQENFFKAIA